MPFSFKVYTRLTDLMPVMSSMGAAGVPVCRGIDTIENTSVSDLENYYVLSFKDGQLCCVSYYQLLYVKPCHFNLGDKKIQQAALSVALKVVRPTLLVAGNLFRHDVVFQQFTDTQISDEDKADIFMETTRYLTMHTRASGIFLKDVPGQMAGFIQQDHSYTQMEADVSMEMDIPEEWKTFQDYEKALKHKYLQRCRKLRKTFSDITVRQFSADDILHYCHEMEALYLQVAQKQMVSMGLLNHRFFIELKRALGDDYRVCGYFHHEKLVAFSSAILHDGEYDMNYIGFDYAYNQSHHLYFNILFHCLENALATGCNKLILGRTAPEAKAIMGCKPDYRFSFYKLRNVIVNAFFIMVSGYFRQQQGEKWKDRHPFKSSIYATDKGASKIFA